MNAIGGLPRPGKPGKSAYDIAVDEGFSGTPAEWLASMRVPTFLKNSGRFYCYTDNRWVTDSDDNYGSAYYQFSESGGSGSEPVIEWEHMGVMLPAGVKIKSLLFGGRANNPEVTDLEIRAVMRKPDPITRWQTGFDNDNEDIDTELFSSNFRNASMTGASNDTMGREFPIGAVTDAMCFLSIYVRPVGTLTANRYFISTHTWVIGD